MYNVEKVAIDMNIQEALYYLMGKVYIDHGKVNDKDETLLHISDTPSQFYPQLKKLINIIKPNYIIHTGDVVDNVKLEIYPSSFARFETESLKILKLLNNSDAERIFITKGNHDDFNYLKENGGRIQFVEFKDSLTINDITFVFGHYSEDIRDIDGDIYLFGHDLSIPSQTYEGKVYLNGISNMHLINLKTKEIINFDYPYGINNARLNRHRLGI